METVTLTVQQLGNLLAAATKSVLEQELQPLIDEYGAGLRKSLDAIVAARRAREERVRTKARVLGMAAAPILKADQAAGIVTSIRAVTGNVDETGDRIMPGSFVRFIQAVKSGAEPWPAQVLNHQVDPLVLTGVTRDMEELMPGDARLPAKFLANGWGGLQTTTQYNLETTAGRDAFSNVRGGFLSASSFMFWPSVVTDVNPRERLAANHVQDIKEIFPVVEFSDVLMPANRETVHISVKSAGDEILEERLAMLNEAYETSYRQRSAEPIAWPETPNFRTPEGFSGGAYAPFTPLERAMARLVARR